MGNDKRTELTGYELSRDFFDYMYEHPEKANPTATALYYFIVEHCNRLGWKEKFGLPTTMAMEAIGIRNYKTYKKALDALIESGFIKMVEKSRNQYSSNIVALAKNTKALGKALGKASTKHLAKQVQSTASIDKLLNLGTKELNNSEIEKLRKTFLTYQEHLLTQTNQERLGMNLSIKPNNIGYVIKEFLDTCYANIAEKHNAIQVEQYFINWVRAKDDRIQDSVNNQIRKRNEADTHSHTE